MPETTTQEQAKPVLFAIVNLFGHQKVAGAVSEQQFGGAGFVRVDVPEVTYSVIDYDAPRTAEGYQKVTRTIPAHTRSFGPSAIYGIDWCDEQTARLAAQGIRDEPLEPYSVRQAIESMRASDKHLLAAPARLAPEDRDDN